MIYGSEKRNRQLAYSHVCEMRSKDEIKLLRVDPTQTSITDPTQTSISL